MRAREFLLEAAYDAKINSMTNKWQNLVPESVSDVQWAKKLGRQDIVFWYLHNLEKYYLNVILKFKTDNSSDEGEKKDYLNLADKLLTNNIPAFQNQLQHYLGYTYVPGIVNYRFDINRSPPSTFNELEQIVKAWQAKQTRESPVYPELGDKIIIDYGNTAWWLLERGYCGEEGRSGDHCGNVAGERDPNQRILSFRKKDNKDPNGWNVILTFILHLNKNQISGILGEMKAKSNNKPAPNYHKPILDLLMSDIVTGITSGGYAPENNFSVFDFDEPTLKMIDEKKPLLIREQIKTGNDGQKIFELPEWLKIKYKDIIQETYGELIFYAEPAMLEKLFKAIGEYVRDYMYEYAFDMEVDDDGYNQWQTSEALRRGYYSLPSDYTPEELEDMPEDEIHNMAEIDWDKVNEDDDINDYLKYNDELRWAIDGIIKVQLTSGNAIKQYTKDYEEEVGDDYGTTEIKNLDTVYSFIITQENNKRDYFIQHIAEWIEKKIAVYPPNHYLLRKDVAETPVEHDGVTWIVIKFR